MSNPNDELCRNDLVRRPLRRLLATGSALAPAAEIDGKGLFLAAALKPLSIDVVPATDGD